MKNTSACGKTQLDRLKGAYIPEPLDAIAWWRVVHGHPGVDPSTDGPLLGRVSIQEARTRSYETRYA